MKKEFRGYPLEVRMGRSGKEKKEGNGDAG
jgi:hypothetical protein